MHRFKLSLLCVHCWWAFVVCHARRACLLVICLESACHNCQLALGGKDLRGVCCGRIVCGELCERSEPAWWALPAVHVWLAGRALPSCE